MYSALNAFSEYTYFYISKNITSYTFLLAFKIAESPQCILKEKWELMQEFHITLQLVSFAFSWRCVVITEAVVWRCSVKKCSLKFRKIHRKTAVSECLF